MALGTNARLLQVGIIQETKGKLFKSIY